MWIETPAGELRVRQYRARPADIVLWSGLFFNDHQHRPLAELLVEAGLSVVLVNPPGFGGSGPPPVGLTMEGCGDALAEVARRCARPGALIGGTSWGGIAAIHAALRHPDASDGLLLFNTPILAGSRQGFMRWIPTLASLSPTLFAWGARASLLGRKSRRSLAPVIAQSLRFTNRAEVRQVSKLVLHDRPDLSQRLAELRQPALVVLGPEDGLYDALELRTMWASAPSATVVEAPETGHSSALEDPEAVAAAVSAFVKRLAGDPRLSQRVSTVPPALG